MDDEKLIQGSEAWRLARAGSLGASQVSDALARTKTGWGASRANVMASLVVERLTGQPVPTFVNDAMRWGTQYEPEARDVYSFTTGVDVQEVGLMRHPKISWSHASLDGVVGTDGFVEIKCPQAAAMLDVLLSQKVPEKYLLQIHWQMAVSGRAWCDFVQYHPQFPSDLQMFVRRVHRDDAIIEMLEAEVVAFLTELDAKLDQLSAIGRRAAA